MLKFKPFRRQDDRPSDRRPRTRRQPLVEDLEGRRLLSTVAPAIVGNHIGFAPAAIQGNHIGVVADGIVGQHIGTNVA